MKNKMRVLLLDLDIKARRRAFPNLALMKLSAYHKARGDEVFLNFPLQQADIAYASCIFTWNAKRAIGLPLSTVIGGGGIDSAVALCPDIEHTRPDYKLYPGLDYSIGFTSRGCPRHCPWCVVPEKEGGIKPWASIYEFWDRHHTKIKLLDNNLLASSNWRETMEHLIAEQVEVDFNQGLDIRLVNEENAWYLSRVNAKNLRFAFDDIGYEKAVRDGAWLLTEAGIHSRKLSFYVLYGFKADDYVIERMKILADLNVDVYPMAYRGNDGKEPNRSLIYSGSIMWHGAYRNRLKFLRLVGRLPE